MLIRPRRPRVAVLVALSWIIVTAGLLIATAGATSAAKTQSHPCHGHNCPSPSPTATPKPSATPTPTPSPGSGFAHIFVVVEENHGYGQIVGSSSAPYINSLISQNALASQYYAITHPSLPNYLALTGGSTFGITTDCGPLSCPVSAANIADRLSTVGKSWKTYAESMPSSCYLSDSGSYRVHHNPFVYFNDVRTDTTRCSTHILPYTSLATDLGSASSTPTLSLIIPNICDDMHDCSIGTGDTWLKNQLPKIFASPAWTTQRSLLILTFDEDEGSEGNHVVTVFVGPYAKAGYKSSTHYTHYSLLRTLEVELGLSSLTSNDGSASAMTDLLR